MEFAVDLMADGDDFLNFLLFGSAIAWICCGVYVAKPNLHGIKFKEGTCNITSVETISLWDDLPTCSCGKSCSEEYPCLTVRGYYWANSSGSTPVPGTFHSDYKALSKECFHIPDCKKKYTENSVEVYKYYTNHVNGPYPSYTNITFHNFTDYKEFSCWGYENTMYFDHSYNVTLVYVSLIIPGVFFLIAVICSILFGTDSQRECLIGWVMLPLLVIGGILACVWEIVSEFLPDCCVDGLKSCGSCIKSIVCCKFMKKEQENEAEMEGVSEVTERRNSGQSTRRNSLILYRSGSLVLTRTGSMDLPRRASLELTPGLATSSASNISLEVAAPGPTYDVGGSDVLPPPPSYDEAIATGGPDRSAPSYDDVIKSS